MEESRLLELIEAYGAAPERWPEEERREALALLERSSRAQQRLEEEARLDADLSGLHPPPASAGIKARIRDRAAARSKQRRHFLRQTVSWLARPARLAPSGALAASAVAGILLGLSVTSYQQDIVIDVETALYGSVEIEDLSDGQ